MFSQSPVQGTHKYSLFCLAAKKEKKNTHIDLNQRATHPHSQETLFLFLSECARFSSNSNKYDGRISEQVTHKTREEYGHGLTVIDWNTSSLCLL